MKSILEGRPALKTEIDKIAEVAGYLWQNGWAERNGGNITVNITDYVDDAIRAMPAISEAIEIGETLPHLKGQYFYCKGTGKRMRDLARDAMANGSVIRILDDCQHYVIIADNAVMPTSELPSHLLVHDRQVELGSGYKATVHTHPIELVAMSHNRAFLGKARWRSLKIMMWCCGRNMASLPKGKMSWMPSTRLTCSPRARKSISTQRVWALPLRG